MNNETPRYSDHYEIIVALVTYLAVCKRRAKDYPKTMDDATAGWLAEHLGLEAYTEEVEHILNSYKSLFRKSNKPYQGHYLYSLLLRYSRRLYKENQASDVCEPLSNDELFSLLDFISSKVKMEQEEKSQVNNYRYQLLAMGIAVLSTMIAAASSLYVAFIGR